MTYFCFYPVSPHLLPLPVYILFLFLLCLQDLLCACRAGSERGHLTPGAMAVVAAHRQERSNTPVHVSSTLRLRATNCLYTTACFQPFSSLLAPIRTHAHAIYCVVVFLCVCRSRLYSTYTQSTLGHLEHIQGL